MELSSGSSLGAVRAYLRNVGAMELAPSVVSRDVGGSAGTRCVGSVGGCAAVGARTRLVLRQDGGYGCRRVPFD